MKRAMALATIASLLLTSVATAADRRLHGQILRLGEDDRPVPVEKNIRVVIDEIGATKYTEDNGLFDYLLRDRDRPNKEITLRVMLDNYVVHDPLDGQTRIPKDSELDRLMRLLMVRKGSPALLTGGRFNKTIQVATAEGREQIEPVKGERPVPVKLEVSEAASRLGFSDEAFNRWILEQAARLERSPDPQAQARAAAAQNDFKKAGDLERQAMDRLAETYARAKPQKQHGPPGPSLGAIVHRVSDTGPPSAEELERLAQELVNGYRFAGHAYYNAYEFGAALRSYTRAAQYVSREDSLELWAAIQVDIGRAAAMAGIRTEGAAIQQLLAQAAEAYRAALTVRTKEQLPQQWAMTQNNLGIVLRNQGTRTGREEGKELVRQAINVFQLALQIRTRDMLPVQWEQTMGNLEIAKQALEYMMRPSP